MLVGPSEAPDVLALVPTLGGNPDRLRRSVDAVVSQSGGLRVAVVCLVNSPEKGRVSDLPRGVEIVECGLNLGWGGALRFGRTRGEATYVWTVQDDMVAEQDCLERLVRELVAGPELAAVSPVAVDADGVVPWGSLGGTIDRDLQWSWYPPEATSPHQLVGHDQLQVVASRGMLVRTTAWDAVGGTDPRLHPVMCSDLSICHAFLRLGLRSAIVPDAVVVHERHGSTTRPFADFLTMRNRAVFVASWYPGREAPDALRPSPAEALDGVVHPDLPPELVASVAQAAADTVLHLGAVHTAAVEGLRARNTDLERSVAQATRTRHEERQAALDDVRRLRARIGDLERSAGAAARTREEERQAELDDVRRLRRRLRRTRRRLAVARSWRGRLGLARSD